MKHKTSSALLLASLSLVLAGCSSGAATSAKPAVCTTHKDDIAAIEFDAGKNAPYSNLDAASDQIMLTSDKSLGVADSSIQTHSQILKTIEKVFAGCLSTTAVNWLESNE